MPYARNSELPASVRNALPLSAQTVFRNVVNSQLGRGLSEQRAFRSAWGALKNQGWEKGEDGKWHKVGKAMEDFEIRGEIQKLNEEKRIAYGWASVISKSGEPVVDQEGDVIFEDDLLEAAHAFMLESRAAGDSHIFDKISGDVVESMVFTEDLQNALGIDLGQVGWMIGVKVKDEEVWKKLKTGEYKMFSIGGGGQREELTDG